MDTQGKLIPENTGILLHDQSDAVYPIRYLVDNYTQGDYDLPLHQREFVWKHKKQKDWLRNLLKSNYKPCGVIVIYQIRYDDRFGSKKYINDGYQRIYTIIKAKASPEIYELADKDINDILAQTITVQFRIYNSHEDAAEQFQYLNIGTAMTAYEYYKTRLVYLKDYKLYEKIINNITDAMLECDHQISSKTPTTEIQKRIRDIYGLIVRTLTSDYTTYGRQYMTISNKKPDEKYDDKNIELTLKTELGKIKISEFEVISKKIISEIYLIAALIADCIPFANELIKERNSIITKDYGKVDVIQKNYIAYKLWRWIFINIYALKMNKISIENIKKIIIEILAITGGKANKSFMYKNENYALVTNYQNVITFKNIFIKIGFKDILEPVIQKSRKRRNTDHIRRGFDYSHPVDKPFSSNGECEDSEMFIESASLNRSRGNKVKI